MSEVIIKINGSAFLGVEKANKKSLLSSAIFVTTQAKSLAPSITGLLRNSIMYNTNKKKGLFNNGGGEKALNELTTTTKENSAIVGTNLLYGTYIEFGTKNMKAQPYLRPAGELLKIDNIKKINEEEMAKALKKGVKLKKFSSVS